MGDREIVMDALRQNGRSLRLASEYLQKDRDIVMAEVKQDGSAIQFASEDLQRDGR